MTGPWPLVNRIVLHSMVSGVHSSGLSQVSVHQQTTGGDTSRFLLLEGGARALGRALLSAFALLECGAIR